MLYLLVCTMGALLILSYWLNDADILAPSFLFMLGFFACVIMTTIAAPTWNYEASARVVGVITFGCSLFIAVSFVTHSALKPRTKNFGRSRADMSGHALIVTDKTLRLMIILEAAICVWTLIEIARMFPSLSLFDAIGMYKRLGTFSTENISFSQPLNLARIFFLAGGYFVSYQLAQAIVKKQKQIKLLLTCFVFVILMTIETGGRTRAIGYIICLVLTVFLLKRKESGINKIMTFGRAVVAICAVVVFASAFQYSAIGRNFVIQGVDYSGFEYLSIYIGAEIPNLDMFLNSSGIGCADIWGQMTFIRSINYLGGNFHISEWIYTLDLPNLFMNGHWTGNVCTCFYSYLYDFGYIGAAFLTAIMAFISQIVYEKARLKHFENDFSVFLYSVVAYALILSFFSNKFYENFFAIPFLRTVIAYLIFKWVFCKKVTRKSSAKGIELN